LFYKSVILFKRQIKTLAILTFLLVSAFSLAQSIQEIVIQDNKKTKASFIKKIIDLKIGQPLDSLLMDRDMIRLKREAAIAHAYYQVYEIEKGYKIVYGVQENFTIIPYFNFYTTDEDEVAYRVGVTEFNTLGKGISVGLFYQKDIFDSYGLNVRAPYLINKKWGVSINIQSLTTEEPVFFNNQVAQYKYNNTAYTAGILHQFNLNHRAEIAYSTFTEDYRYLRGATSNDVPRELEVDKHLIKFIYEYNGVDSYYQYHEGFKSNFNLQYVESSDSSLPSFTIWRNDFTYFHRVGNRGNWANRLRVGFSTNDESPFAPFAVDNNLNIRGVGNVIDRGTGALVLNTEYRYSFIDKDWFVLQGNAFVDAGSWRNPGGDISDFGDSQNFRVYPGLGMRFIHKRIFNTIFRIDYGVGITPDATQGFVFGIGQYF
jgi:outer membrane protein assembly factor BamA